MSNKRNFFKYWLPVLVWMAVIFTASSDPASSQRSSRIIGPLLHWLFPDISQETTDAIVFAVRKCAHLTEYGVLALLAWRALRKPARKDSRPWSWSTSSVAMLIVILYAVTDEIHQMFVPTRQGRFHDVVIDSTGGLVALLLLWALGRWRKWW